MRRRIVAVGLLVLASGIIFFRTEDGRMVGKMIIGHRWQGTESSRTESLPKVQFKTTQPDTLPNYEQWLIKHPGGNPALFRSEQTEEYKQFKPEADRLLNWPEAKGWAYARKLPNQSPAVFWQKDGGETTAFLLADSSINGIQDLSDKSYTKTKRVNLIRINNEELSHLSDLRAFFEINNRMLNNINSTQLDSKPNINANDSDFSRFKASSSVIITGVVLDDQQEVITVFEIENLARISRLIGDAFTLSEDRARYRIHDKIFVLDKVTAPAAWSKRHQVSIEEVLVEKCRSPRLGRIFYFGSDLRQVDLKAVADRVHFQLIKQPKDVLSQEEQLSQKDRSTTKPQ